MLRAPFKQTLKTVAWAAVASTLAGTVAIAGVIKLMAAGATLAAASIFLGAFAGGIGLVAGALAAYMAVKECQENAKRMLAKKKEAAKKGFGSGSKARGGGGNSTYLRNSTYYVEVNGRRYYLLVKNPRQKLKRRS